MAEKGILQEFLDTTGLAYLWSELKNKFARHDLSNFSTYGPKVYVPEQTIEMRSTRVAIPGMDRIGLVEGETYTVKFNGTTYTCVAKWAYGALVLGNPDLVGYPSDTDEPFIIEDVPDSMLSFVGGPANIVYSAQKYEYTVTARTDGGGQLTAEGIGDHVVVGSEVKINDEWHTVDEVIDNNTVSFVYLTFAEVGDIITVYHDTVSVSVDGTGETNQQINPKYLPPYDWSQNDERGAGYIKHRTHWQEEAYLPLCEYKVGSSGKITLPAMYMQPGETYKVNWLGTIYECVAEGESYMTQITHDLFTIQDIAIFGYMSITPADTTLTTVTMGITGPGYCHKLDEKFLPVIPIEKGGTDAATAERARQNLGAVAMTTVAVTLAADGWSGSQQTVTVTGVTGDEESCHVIPSPAPSSRETYAEAGIYCSAQADGALTFTCESVPSEAITVNVAVFT